MSYTSIKSACPWRNAVSTADLARFIRHANLVEVSRGQANAHRQQHIVTDKFALFPFLGSGVTLLVEDMVARDREGRGGDRTGKYRRETHGEKTDEEMAKRESVPSTSWL